MACFHKNLTQEKWNSLSKDKQILNIASELMRAKGMFEDQEDKYLINSLNRALELVDLTINDKDKWQNGSLKEILRFREYLAGFYQEKKSIDSFLQLIRNFLLFHPNSAVVQI